MKMATIQPPTFFGSMDKSNFDINNIDFEMREIVLLLRNHNVETVASCTGGEGHNFEAPTIRCESDNPRHDVQRIGNILRAAGYSRLYIKPCYTVDNDFWLIEIQWWSLDALMWEKLKKEC